MRGQPCETIEQALTLCLVDPHLSRLVALERADELGGELGGLADKGYGLCGIDGH
jgi:hypothetical protein